jgi:hypothetical protein
MLTAVKNKKVAYMQIVEIASRAVPVLVVILIIIAIWAVIEIALTVRKARASIEGVNETVAKADPLIEHTTLTVDALNLELMRIDQILEDVEQVTDAATSAAETVTQISAAPMELASSIADHLRAGAKNRSRARAAQKAQNQSMAAHAAIEEGTDEAACAHEALEATVPGKDEREMVDSKESAVQESTKKRVSPSSASQGVTVIEPSGSIDTTVAQSASDVKTEA